jgi:class 3 adenylate cyclase
VLWAVLFAVYLGPMGTRPPLLLVLFGLVALCAVWTVVWLVMSGPPLQPWLKYALIWADAWVIIRAAVLSPLVPSTWFAETFHADLLAVTPPLLVYLALSGALRLDPAAAAFSTAIALLGLGAVAVAEGQPAREALEVGAVILFAGGLGVGVSYVLRYVALKAREGEVLGPYVPETLTRELARSGEPERAGRQEEVTVLMADIRGFTRLSQHLRPADAVRLLNDYFDAVVGALLWEGAILDRYLGDGILAHFEGDDRAGRALRAALAMRRSVDRMNTAHPDREALAIGIALHAGPVLVGTIGPPTRREYTIIGDVVNVSDRLEKSNKELGSVLVASVDALAGVADPSSHGLLGPRQVTVHGHDQPIAVHYLPETRRS